MHHVLITTTFQSDPDHDLSPVGVATVTVACETSVEAVTVADAVNRAPSATMGVVHHARILGPHVVIGCPDCKALEATVARLESQRPHWAQGYTSDGVAAQAATGALSSLWGMLGATDQTQAMQRLTALVQPKPTRGISDDEALIMEAFDFGQFAADTLGIGGSNRGLAEPVRAALVRVLELRYKELYGCTTESAARK